jgi:hypothetical protein
MTNVISEYEFASVYQPISNHLDRSAPFNFGSLEGTLFETFGNDLAFVKSQARQMIWTLLATEGHVTIFSGYHFVNRIGYFVCRKPVESDALIEVRIG